MLLYFELGLSNKQKKISVSYTLKQIYASFRNIKFPIFIAQNYSKVLSTLIITFQHDLKSFFFFQNKKLILIHCVGRDGQSGLCLIWWFGWLMHTPANIPNETST